MKTAIYCRVSTEDQTLAQQLEVCKHFCLMKGWRDVDVYKEVQSSRKERPVFQEVLRRTRNNEYHAIVVFRLDRAWRSSRQFIMDFDNLQSLGKHVISVQEGLDPSTPMGRCIMTILVALAELEREQISLATKQRLQALKDNKVHLGRPFGSKDNNKRKTEGYRKRWSKRRGGKQVTTVSPETVTLKSDT